MRREPQVTARQGGTVNDLPVTVTSALSHPVSATARSGRQVKLPVRFREQRTLHWGSVLKKGGSCKVNSNEVSGAEKESRESHRKGGSLASCQEKD